LQGAFTVTQHPCAGTLGKILDVVNPLSDPMTPSVHAGSSTRPTSICLPVDFQTLSMPDQAHDDGVEVPRFWHDGTLRGKSRWQDV